MKSLQEFIKKETKRFRKWTKGAYEIKPEVQCGIPCLTGTRITKSSVENYFKSVLQEAGEVAVRECARLCRDEFNNLTYSAEEIENKILSLLKEK